MENNSSYSLYELNEFIRRIVALNIPRAIWVCGEIAQCNLSRGHLYLNLIEKEEGTDELLAKSDAVIWATNYRRLKRKFGKSLEELMQEGVEIKILVRVDFNERYGLKLIVEDVDTVYTMGKLETKRRETIALLLEKQLLYKNKEVEAPIVLQRIAVISSETAAGYQDFMAQLNKNAYGYTFQTRLYPAAMQGPQSAPEIIQQLDRIQRSKSYDCVVITRGGGARLDLLAFDDYELNKKVAKYKIPVIVGVGHETDECIVDLVAHTSLKTPTAVAEYLIAYNLQFESNLLQLGQELYLNSQENINSSLLWLEEASQILRWQSLGKLKNETQELNHLVYNIQKNTASMLRQTTNELKHMEELCHFLSPEATLKRGYSLTTKNGKIITDTGQLKKGDQIESHLKTKTLVSEIIEINPSQL